MLDSGKDATILKDADIGSTVAAYTKPYAYIYHNHTNSVPAFVENCTVLNPTATELDWETSQAGLPWEKFYLYNTPSGITDPLAKKITFSDVVSGVFKLEYTLEQLSNRESDTPAAGAMLYYNGTKWVKIAKGTNGQVLTMVNGIPAWA